MGDHVLYQPTFPMAIPLFMCFITVDRFFSRRWHRRFLFRALEIQWSFPFLYIWHACCRHAGTFTPPSTHRLLLKERLWAYYRRRRRRNNPCSQTRPSRPPLQCWFNYAEIIAAVDEENSILEFLYIVFSLEDNSTILRFPKSLQAPYRRQLLLQSFALPIGSWLLTTTVGPVWASSRLAVIHSSVYFHPIKPLRWIFLMPHLETLKFVLISLFPTAPSRKATHAYADNRTHYAL